VPLIRFAPFAPGGPLPRKWGETLILKHGGAISEVGDEEGDSLMHGVLANARAVLHFAGRDSAALKAIFSDCGRDAHY
jgi:hypothetical protein